MSETARPNIAIREASVADAARLSLVADATFLETFAGMIDGEALVAHCAHRHAVDHLRERLGGGARAWLAELDGAPVGYAMLVAPELEAAQRAAHARSQQLSGQLARQLCSERRQTTRLLDYTTTLLHDTTMLPCPVV